MSDYNEKTNSVKLYHGDELLGTIKTNHSLTIEQAAEMLNIDLSSDEIDYNELRLDFDNEVKNSTLVILEGNCGDEGPQFRDFMIKNHPEIKIDYRANTSGVGGGLFNDTGDKIDDGTQYWEEYCNS
jgi:hypothetical protein